MKKSMVFHYLFIFWLGGKVIFNLIPGVLLLPFSICQVIKSPSNIMIWQNVLVATVVLSIGICSVPLFYALLHRLNYSKRKLFLFLIPYILIMLAKDLTLFVGKNWYTDLDGWMWLLGNYAFVIFICWGIVRYYKKRAHLFTTINYNNYKESLLAVFYREWR
ncbi:MAG: hypothetical protein ACRCST_05560 [Turicibacter sp.]